MVHSKTYWYGYRYGITALSGKSYPMAGLTTSKEFTTQIRIKIKPKKKAK